MMNSDGCVYARRSYGDDSDAQRLREMSSREYVVVTSYTDADSTCNIAVCI